MKQIIQYIEDHNISEEEVAQAAHMSLRNLRRQIHSKNRTQVRIVLLLADKQNQSIDSIFFDEMNNQPISLEGLTINQIQDIIKLVHPELFMGVTRSKKIKDYNYNLETDMGDRMRFIREVVFLFHKLNSASIWKCQGIHQSIGMKDKSMWIRYLKYRKVQILVWTLSYAIIIP